MKKQHKDGRRSKNNNQRKKPNRVNRRRPLTASRSAPKANEQIPLIELPLYKLLSPSPHWYGLLPNIVCIQGEWIQNHITKLKLPPCLDPYVKNAINLHHTALIVAGNNRAYFALYSLRPILERVAMAWTIHSESAVEAQDIVKRLSHKNKDERKNATLVFMNSAQERDPLHKNLYEMVSQYFAHASKMDGVSLAMENKKDEMLYKRIQVMPLLLLLDAGNRLVFLIKTLLEDQGIDYNPPHGEKEEGKFDIELYVRGCTYVMCEKHSPKKGVRMATLMRNISGIKGEIGITTIYRGGMEVHRYGNPADKPDPIKIANFSWFGVGKGHDDKVKVRCIEKTKTGERYKLSWPKYLEIDSTGVAAIAQHGQGNVEFFDYISAFLKVLEEQATC